MEKRSFALRIRKLLLEYGFDKGQADALALVFDEVYHAQMSEVANKDDIKAIREDIKSIKEDMKMFMEMTNKRFEDMNKKFEDLLYHMDKRFEEVNKRITIMQWFLGFLFTAYLGIIAFLITYVLPMVLK